jgi:putative zinc-dependent peptidase DUF5700
MIFTGGLAFLLASPFAGALQEATPPPGPTEDRVQVHMVADEAEAVLDILDKRADAAEVTAADWQKLFAAEGYRRLKKREESMKRAFTDDDFKKFVTSPELAARLEKLHETLDSWKEADISRPAQLALVYLPAEATIKATVYPVIKPKENSFVFEVGTDPAIFLYLDPEVDRAEFENTLAHELHHIGYGTACPTAAVEADTEKQAAPVKKLREWVSAFGEGFAMLAAAGGPDVHPRDTASQEKHERWDLDMGQFYQNRIALDDFFMQILKGQLSGEKADEKAFTFFGYQGPWYTVGYRMDVTIEHAFGRDRLIEAMCDGSVLEAYNEAISNQTGPAGLPKGKPEWSPEIIKALHVEKPKPAQEPEADPK